MAETVYGGIGVSEGIQIGKVYKYKPSQSALMVADISEDNAEKETARFNDAVAKAVSDIDRLIEKSSKTIGGDKIGVLKGQKSILSDPTYCPEIEKLIRRKLFTAEKAVKQVTDKFVMIFKNMKNDYMKERAADVQDVGRRLLSVLSGHTGSALSDIDNPVILIADDLLPSDTIQLNKQFVLAFITQKGGKTAHTSIFAKSMGIPAVVGVKDILNAAVDGDTVIVDGEEGVCILSPDPETLERYYQKKQCFEKKKDAFSQYIHKKAVTNDGCEIIVAANIGSADDVEYSLSQGAQAVGLLRTEQLYLLNSSMPDENQLFNEYKKITEAYGEREVIIRTLDIGGDKGVSYLNIPKEDNPFLGYRAIRLCLDRKELFLSQIRAILRASTFGNLKIMFPMISGYDELLSAKDVLEEAKSQLRAQGIAFDEKIKTGIMIEIPSAAMMADALAKEADFFSIGTNDLVQYTIAVDRGNEKVSYLYDYCNPAVIRLIKKVTEAAKENGIPVGMCGDMAGDPLMLPLLVGLNLDELSMSAGFIPKIKYFLSNINKSDCIKLAEKALTCTSASQIRKLLMQIQV